MKKLFLILLLGFVISSSVLAQYKITFYAWDKGNRTPKGTTSAAGHAFVGLEGYGVWGFECAEWEAWTIDKATGVTGKMYNHSNDIGYATLSVSYSISESQYNRAKAVFDSWRNSPGSYRLCSRDCVSFAMKVADAAGISYGNIYDRNTIQYPATFIQYLRKNN